MNTENYYEAYITHADGSTETIDSHVNVYDLVGKHYMRVLTGEVKIDEWFEGVNYSVDSAFWLLDYLLSEHSGFSSEQREQLQETYYKTKLEN